MLLAADSNVWVTVAPVVATLIGVVLGAYLNRKGAVAAAREIASIEKRENLQSRTWELRREGYGILLYNLGEASKYADWLEDGYGGPGGGAHQFYASKQRQEYEGKTSKAWAECQSVFAKNHLIFSKPFINAFGLLRSSLPDEVEVDLPMELAAREAKCFRDGHAELLGIAQAEVGFKETEEAEGTKSQQA